MVDIKLWPHQDKCIESKKNLPKSLINIWCGGGKTRIIVYSIFDDDQEINVIVFPSLGLINQFNNDYILSDDFIDYFKEYTCLSVCSDSESKLKIKTDIIRYTTKESKIKSTLKKTGKKLFTVTYQSLELFVNILVETNTIVNRLYYDEAHHIMGSIIQKIVFENETFNELTEKTEYYTATPENRNGITMYDREHPENSDCGPIAYEYLFYQAVKDMISKDFTMKLMLYPKTEDDKYINLFESIFRECFTGEYAYWNILTFHSMVEEKDELATVNELSKKISLFKKAFLKVIEEFPEKKELYSVDKVFLKGVGSKTKGREKIIEGFDKPEIGRIYLLASCKTLGEGIDTKYANMEIPINPGGSLVYEQQKLGRITRNPGSNNPNGIVLIPCWIDMDKYEGLDKYERDEMIRQELHEGGNFNTFLNVMSAYKNQEDPELWELCLKYPNMYSPKEIKSNLDKQGFKVDESKGDLIENVNHIMDKDISDLVGETDEETIQNIVENTNKQVEIHSQDLENPIVTYGTNDSDEPIRLFKDEEGNYHPISKKEPSEKRRKIEKPDKPKRKKLINVHMNDEIKVLWKIDEDVFDPNNTFRHGVLNAEIDYNEEKWYENLDNCKKHMDTNNNKPSENSNNECEKKLGCWFGNNKHKYNNNLGIFKKDKFKKSWESFMNDPKYSQHFMSFKDTFVDNIKKCKSFIDINEQRPRCECENPDEQLLGQWLISNIGRYNNKEKYFMENYLEEWGSFVNDSKYKDYFKTDDENWNDILEGCKKFMDNENKRPRAGSSDENEKSFGYWLTDQFKQRTIRNENREKLWNEFINDPKYSKYLISLKGIWKNNIEKLKHFMNIEKRVPIAQEEDKLGIWFQQQKIKYSSKTLNEERTKIWTEMINNPIYSQYIMSRNELWLNKLLESKHFIYGNKRLPNKRDKNEHILGCWIGTNKTHYNKKNEYFMENYLEEWESFVNDPKYVEYFKTPAVIWLDKLNLFESHIINKTRFPSPNSDNLEDKKLGIWKERQKSNYIHTLGEMKNPEIKQKWNECMDKYKHLSGHNSPSLFDLNKWNEMFLKFRNVVDDKNIIPFPGHELTDVHELGKWKERINGIYKHTSGVMKDETIYKTWNTFINSDLYKKAFENNKIVRSLKLFMIEYTKVIDFEKDNKYIPKSCSSDNYEKKIGEWLNSRRQDYNHKLLSKEKIDLLEKLPGWFWNAKDKKKKDMSKKEIKSKQELTGEKRIRFKSEMSVLHQKYKTMNSQTLHKHFEDNPDDWTNYHKISESNEETFPDEEIPYKKIIQYLEHIPGKKKKDVADLGCGKARVCEHFKGSDRFKFINMDHVSNNDLVMKQDIKNTGLDDYSMDVVVLSLAMWGSNCKEYITEANRILDENGVLLIIEATKRWTEEETNENKLVKLLEEKGFTIKNKIEEKFMFIECIKQ